MKQFFRFSFTFFCLFSLFLYGCASGCTSSVPPDIPSPDPSLFYRALKAESRFDIPGAVELFEQSLDSASFKIRREAAWKLAALMPFLDEREETEGAAGQSPSRKNPAKERARRILARLDKEAGTPGNSTEPAFISLKAAAFYVLGQYQEITRLYDTGNASSQRDKALTVLSRIFLDFASQKGEDSSPGTSESAESRLEGLRELFYGSREGSGPGNSPQAAAVREQDRLFRWMLDELVKHGLDIPAADMKALEGRFAVSRNSFDEALLCFEALRKENQGLFFRYPGLLSDLGRTFQGIPSKRAEGLKLFAEWEKSQAASVVRYTLLFYSGRIKRQQGKNDEAIPFFTRALEFVPDERQEDACIWYILDTAIKSKNETAAGLVKTYAKRWRRPSYFSDILDELCCNLVRARSWADLGAIIPLIQDAPAAQYAYITGRAIQEGYVSLRGKTAADFFAIAYEEGNASFYYRALAASALGKTVVPLAAPASAVSVAEDEEILAEFYRGFFDYGAEEFALYYLRRDMEDLSVPFLRTIAGFIGRRGEYLDSISIVRSYMRREGYKIERADLELYYPRAFTGIIDENANSSGIAPPVFYGLVRTESGFMPEIVSHAGAVGLAQIMPATAREVNAMIKKRGGPDFSENGSIDLRKPETNVYIGAFYLNYLTGSLGSPMLALLAYNGGPAKIRRLRRAAPSIPEDLFLETITTAETREYGKRVMAAAAAYGYLYYGMTMEEIVADIFK